MAAPAGLNAYIPLLALALAQYFGWVDLSRPYDLIGSWWAIALIALLLVVDVAADKIPLVDHVNDAIQTVVRPAAGVHSVKATARPVVNVSTVGVGAPVVSTVEDVGASILSVLALAAPVLAVILVVALLITAILAVRRLRMRRRRLNQP